MEMGIGIPPWVYYQTDDKANNLLHPLSAYIPREKPGDWDANGWPKSLPAGQQTPWYIPTNDRYVRPGKYEIRAKGTGKIWFTGSNGVVKSFVSQGAGVEQVVATLDFPPNEGLFAITETDPADYVRDVKICRQGRNPDATFTPEYLEEMGKFAAFRFTGWANSYMSDCAVDWPANPALPYGEPARLRAHIELCNVTGRDAWYLCPYNASDQHIREVAKLFRNFLRPGLKVYLEWANEVWNWMYPSTTWVSNFTHNELGHPEWSEQAGHAIKAGNFHRVFAEAAPEVQIVRTIGSQFFYLEKYKQVVDIAGRYGITFDAVHTAPYADPMQGGFDEAGAIALLQAGGAANLETVTQRLFNAYDASLAYMTPYANAFKAEAAKNGHRMICYECGPGYSLDPTNPQVELDFLQSSYRDPRMKPFLDRYFAWMAGYYDLAMYTSHTDASQPGRFWGVRSFATETPCPKLDAALQWCAANNRPPLTGIPTVPLTDGGFEQVRAGANQFVYRPAGSPWTFTLDSGLAANGSPFVSGNPAAPEGTQVAFLQINGAATQNVGSLEPGNYGVKLKAAQRAQYQAVRQDLQVLVDGVPVGTITPSGSTFADYQTAPFPVAGHVVTIKGLNTAGGDNTAFVDSVQLVKV